MWEEYEGQYLCMVCGEDVREKEVQHKVPSDGDVGLAGMPSEKALPLD